LTFIDVPIYITVLCAVTPCSLVSGYQRNMLPLCSSSILKMKAGRCFEILVSF